MKTTKKKKEKTNLINGEVHCVSETEESTL